MNIMKNWIIDVIIKKGAPSFIRAGILALGAFFVAQAGILEPFGITFDQTSKVLSLNLNSLETWLIAVVSAGGLGGLIKVFQVQGQAMIPKAKSETPETKA